MKLRGTLNKIAGLMLVVGLLISGCTQGDGGSPDDKSTLSGSIQIAGSTSVQGLSEELAAEFMARNPGVKINVSGGGSGAGIKSAQNGTVDIGASSRELKPEEKQVHEFVIAKDGIAIIVHPDNEVEDMTLEQLRRIFAGKITNWQELGGQDAPIMLVVREEGSGTRDAFEEIVMGEGSKILDQALVQNSTGAVRTAVAGNPDAIGFISVGMLSDEVKALAIDGVEPSAENIVDGSYKIARPFLYLTKEEPQGLVKAFIEFVLSPDEQSIVGESFVPVN